MNKGLKITLISIGVLIIIAIAVALFAYVAIAKSPTVKAQLYVESGEVMVNEMPVASDTVLKENDVVSTGSNGKASIILYESVIISLEPNTEIKISELVNSHPKVEQSSGETWNQFTKFSGVEEYTISYGDSVASVRGTAFSLTKSKIVTGEGIVEYIINGNNFSVGENDVVETFNNRTAERKANAAEIAKIEQKSLETIEKLKILRDKEIAKNSKAYELVKEKTGLTDEDVKKALNDADAGKLDLKEFAGKSPVKLESVDKIIQITEKIKELNKTVTEKAVVREKIIEEANKLKSSSNANAKSDVVALSEKNADSKSSDSNSNSGSNRGGSGNGGGNGNGNSGGKGK